MYLTFMSEGIDVGISAADTSWCAFLLDWVDPTLALLATQIGKNFLNHTMFGAISACTVLAGKKEDEKIRKGAIKKFIRRFNLNEIAFFLLLLLLSVKNLNCFSFCLIRLLL